MALQTAGSSPGFAEHPEHKITVSPSGKRVRAVVGDTVLADSTDALLLQEDGHEPIYYFPRGDVAMDRFTRTDHRTHCPFKGDAAYSTVTVDGRTLENIAWSYERPYDEMAPIRDHVAFYATHLERKTIDGAPVDELKVGRD